MATDIPHTLYTLLHTLLDQHEQPGRQQVRRVHLQEQKHPDYFSRHNATPRQQTNTMLQQLAQQGIVKLHWQTYESGNWLQSVDLVSAQADALYVFLKRTPYYTQEQALRSLLAHQTSHSEWHAHVLQWINDQLDKHRSIAPFHLEDPQKNADLFTALDAIAQLTTLTMERTLSTRLFGNSKRFEELRPSVLNLLRRHDPHVALYEDDERAILRAHYLDRVPEYIPIAGPLRFIGSQHDMDDHVSLPLDISPFTSSVAVPASLLRDMYCVACSAHVVITIENATSFHELLSIRPATWLIICTWGFASPTVLSLLHKISHLHANLAFFHWGDLDPGGLRILRHIRTQVPSITPLAMDSETFLMHQTMAQPLTKNDQRALQQLQTIPELSDCSDVIQCLLQHGKKLEQESIAPEMVVQAIYDRLHS